MYSSLGSFWGMGQNVKAPRGWELPDFAHLPLIHGPDGKKLSKRHGATGLEEFEAKGPGWGGGNGGLVDPP